MSEQLDLLEKLRASTEPRRHLVVLRAGRPPPQDPSLERTEHVALYAHAAARVLGEAADLGDPLRVTTEPACDLNIIDAVVDQAENPALDGPKPVIVWHGCLLVGFCHTLPPRREIDRPARLQLHGHQGPRYPIGRPERTQGPTADPRRRVSARAVRESRVHRACIRDALRGGSTRHRSPMSGLTRFARTRSVDGPSIPSRRSGAVLERWPTSRPGQPRTGPSA